MKLGAASLAVIIALAALRPSMAQDAKPPAPD